MSSVIAFQRIEQVSCDLGRLADELEAFVGLDVGPWLANWQLELRTAAEELGAEPAPSRTGSFIAA
jgi:hypothetical protein